MTVDTISESKEYSSIWEMYGLKANPFSSDPLLVSGGILSMDCFTGRKKESDRMSMHFRSLGGSRLLVVGDVGVGKTSFVNFVRKSAIDKGGYFSPIGEIKIESNWTAADFILNTLSTIYYTLELRQQQKYVDKEILEELKKIARIISINKNIGGNVGVGIFSFGGSYGRETILNTNFNSTALIEFLKKTINEIQKSTKKDIILHYNNLENLKENKIKTLFNDLRDFLQIPNVQFVFVGNLVVSGIIRSIPRVSSIFSETIQLETLSYEEVLEILRKRMNDLSISSKLKIITPFDDSAIKELYKLYEGNLRSILTSLESAVIASFKNVPFILDKNDLATILNKELKSTYLKHINETPLKVIHNMVLYKEITNKSIAENLKMSPSNISNYLHTLEENGCVVVRRKNGKDKFWSVEPKLKWLLLKEDEEAKKQKHLSVSI
ncbi:MAG: ArsR family transcriptional regulator [Candidatus Marsarchaeota archaeon]|nr:ArsR family transcriptional regulator [Candidatus Marsarchaeota archaeon]